MNQQHIECSEWRGRFIKFSFKTFLNLPSEQLEFLSRNLWYFITIFPPLLFKHIPELDTLCPLQRKKYISEQHVGANSMTNHQQGLQSQVSNQRPLSNWSHQVSSHGIARSGLQRTKLCKYFPCLVIQPSQTTLREDVRSISNARNWLQVMRRIVPSWVLQLTGLCEVSTVTPSSSSSRPGTKLTGN